MDPRFAIAYDEFTGTQRNPDLKGEGEFAATEDGRTFTFSGTKRVTFGQPMEMVFARDQIWNVQVRDRLVLFTTSVGEAGRQKLPFCFYARTAQEAAAIAARLPASLDADFTAASEFNQKLALLAGPAKPWTSPTHLIIAANIAVFVAMGVAGAGWFEVADMMPYIRFGANRADLTADGEWWRLVTSMFLHYGLMHLLLNMWALFQAGHLAEKLFGRGLFTLAYFGSGIVGSLATLHWHREHLTWSAGASGAVFGVYGAVFGYMRRERQALPKVIYQPMMKSTLAFAGYNLLYGMMNPHIDNAAHLGGLAGGVLFGWLLALPLDPAVRAPLVARRLGLGLATLALLVALGVGFAPHYSYRLKDELALQEATRPRAEKEKELAQQERTALTAFATKPDAAALTRWLADEAIPFYSRWRDDVTALALDPGRTTAERRDLLAGFLRLKVESYDHLLAALRRNDPEALATFRRDEQRAADELNKLAAMAERKSKK